MDIPPTGMEMGKLAKKLVSNEKWMGSDYLAKISAYRLRLKNCRYEMDIKSFHPTRKTCQGALKGGGEREIYGVR